MQPANKIQNKIHLTRSRSIHSLFALLLNSFGSTVDRRETWFCVPRRKSKSCNVGGDWKADPGRRRCWRFSVRASGVQRVAECPTRFPKRSGIRRGGKSTVSLAQKAKLVFGRPFLNRRDQASPAVAPVRCADIPCRCHRRLARRRDGLELRARSFSSVEMPGRRSSY
jgi:hypothetical protein